MTALLVWSTLLCTTGIILVQGFSSRVSDYPAVTGGIPAKPGQFPHQIIFSYKSWGWGIGVFCGGSLIEVNGTQAILTAGHCMTKLPSYLLAIAGAHHLQATGGELVQNRTVKSFYVHPNYTSHLGASHTLALVFLNDPFELTSRVQPVPLPRMDQAVTGGSVTISGWGTLASYNGIGESPDNFVLHHVSIPVMDKAACKQVWKEYGYQDDGIDNEGHFCVGDNSGGIKSCYADRGSPAVNGEGYLVGVATWGFVCNTFPNLPDIYTSVSENIGWINKVVADYQQSQQSPTWS